MNRAYLDHISETLSGIDADGMMNGDGPRSVLAPRSALKRPPRLSELRLSRSEGSARPSSVLERF